MRFFKFLAAAWAAVAVYCLISLFSGAMGISAQNQLRAEKERLERNRQALAFINEDLENTKKSLADDPDTLMVYARQLGYGQSDEKYIRIVGLGGVANPHTEAGQVMYAETPRYLADLTIKIIALCAALAVFAFFMVFDLRQSR